VNDKGRYQARIWAKEEKIIKVVSIINKIAGEAKLYLQGTITI
jgi:hypothetical protein